MDMADLVGDFLILPAHSRGLYEAVQAFDAYLHFLEAELKCLPPRHVPSMTTPSTSDTVALS